MENYHDNDKLTMNVFEDFEKQTSWQSFTTLLITDIGNFSEDSKLQAQRKKTIGSPGKTKSGVLL